jgi:acetoin utilization protein AcuC
MEIGTDALTGDPLANLVLTNNVYADVIGELLNFDRLILAVGGGGYNIENTVRAWSLAWAALCGDDTGPEEGLGMSVVMPGSTDRQGGLRDKALVPDKTQRDATEQAVEAVIGVVKKNVFPHHGL